MKIAVLSKDNDQPASPQSMISRWIHIQKTLGPAYLYAWLHRLSGVGLLLFLWMHIYTLSFLSDPDQFDQKVAWFDQMGLSYLEWLLAFPVIFHALNGGRLMLYEIFNARRDELMATWVTGLTIIYTFVLLLVMYVSHMSTSPSWWIVSGLFGLGIGGMVIIGTSASGIGIPWKLQRMSGGILLLMIPVHMVLMHVNPMAGHDAGTIIERIQSNILIKAVDITMLLAALYHGAYGMVSIAKDYITCPRLNPLLLVLIGTMSLIFAWLGIQTIILL